MGSGTPPVGKVTMLFTDVEGSTKLAHALGPQWPAVLADHRALMREAIGSVGGHVERTEGDSFFATFTTAAAAAQAAARAQHAMRAHAWPETVGELRVRMGIHTGEVEHTDGHYVGIEVHRAARVGNAAHGGQVLLTAVTRDLLPAGVACQDVGSHRLKDFPEGQRLFHLLVDADRPASEFPPPRALDVRPTNLAPEDRLLVGREEVLAAVRVALLQEGARLVTLTGFGGVGKTRAALAAGALLLEDHPGGVWVVRAEGLRDAGELVPALAAVLRVRDVPGADLLAAVAERLDGPATLVVLDNLEHLAGAPGVVAELLAAAPRLHVLATSRAPLHLAAERPLALEPLAQEEAVRLFTARARAADPGLALERPEVQAAIADVCARLEGLPLALELAAARLRVLTPAQLAERLGSVLDLRAVERDRPERQRSLRATAEWTLGLLPPDARQLFARLAVFVGSPPLEVLEQVCGDGMDVLDAAVTLIDFSLLRRAGSGLELVAALREIAAERLAESGEEPQIRRAHAEAMTAVGERVTPLSNANGALLALGTALVDDLWAALVWARDADPALHRRLAIAAQELMATRGRLGAILPEIQLALENPAVPADDRPRLLMARAHVVALAGRPSEAVADSVEAVALLADAPPRERAVALAGAMVMLDAAGDAEGAVAAGEKALALLRVHGPRERLLHALFQLAQAHLGRRDFERAEVLLTEAEVLAAELDTLVVSALPGCRGDFCLMTGDPARALVAHASSVVEENPYWEWGVAGIVLSLAQLGEHAAALELGAALKLAADAGGLGFDSLTTVPGGLTRARAAARAALTPAEVVAAEAAGRALAAHGLVPRALAVAARVAGTDASPSTPDFARAAS